jgi:hypothetical protein
MAMRIYLQSVWGISSVGRALAWHARGHRFESGILHLKHEGGYLIVTFFILWQCSNSCIN